ncbi:MAG: methionyl-tRNA formyltransferase [Bacteroidales bacterium]|nr:methionyl-tRNA formyltransferase [Bacteroidales bacterium]
MKIKKIVFYGTPEFAVTSLKALSDNQYEISAVVTAPDSQSGRGLKLKQSAVKEFALSRGFKILQPDNLLDKSFIDSISKIEPDIQIVVAFRKLPYEVYSLGKFGTINLHASLLPDYKGAAPINWAVINGEEETGVTTFFINDKIDSGHLILSEKVKISDEMNAGDVHDVLMKVGAQLLLQSLDEICKGGFTATSQSRLTEKGKIFHLAPKIYKKDCKINWTKNGRTIINLIRGLAPLPGAYTELISPDGISYDLKIYNADFIESSSNLDIGKIISDGKTYLRVVSVDGFIDLKEVQLTSKARMDVSSFLRGFQLNSQWIVSPA